MNNELPPERPFFTFRMFATFLALVGCAAAMCTAQTKSSLAVVEISSFILSVTMATVYAITSQPEFSRKLRFGALYFPAFTAFSSSFSAIVWLRLDIHAFHDSREWAPMAPEVISLPIALTAVTGAAFFGYAAINPAKVTE